MNPWLDSLLQAARKGDAAAGRALALHMAECLETGEIPPVLRQYFAQALRQIGRGEKADRALNVAGADKFDRDCEIAREVWRLNHRDDDRLPLRMNRDTDGAYEVVAADNELSAERVKQIYDDLKWLIEAEALSLEPDEPRPEHWPTPPLDNPEWQKANRRRMIAMHLTLARLAEALNKRDLSG
ncbi:hypothetical protein [Devosia sp.]|uniref:hypothetical protein n=1 Tax=Devosia sp. TaxID=1871048 RepID=UPI002FC66EE6